MTYEEIVAAIANYDRVFGQGSELPRPSREEEMRLDAEVGAALDALEELDPPRLWSWDEGSVISTLADLDEAFIEHHYAQVQDGGSRSTVEFPVVTMVKCNETLEEIELYGRGLSSREYWKGV